MLSATRRLGGVIAAATFLLVAMAVPSEADEKGAIADAIAAARGEQQGSTVSVNPQWTIASRYESERLPGLSAGLSSSSTEIRLSPLRRWQAYIGTLPECLGDLAASDECRIPPADPADPTAVVPPLAAVRALAREVVLSLQLPDAGPRIGPDPHANEWDAAMVGYPLWLWTDGPRMLATTRDAYGVTFTLEARHASTRFTMGDGRTVVCAATQPYPASAAPGTPSPVCGHVYEVASLPRGTYTVTATTVWDVRWAALGYSGTLPATMSAARQLPVGELQAVVVR